MINQYSNYIESNKDNSTYTEALLIFEIMTCKMIEHNVGSSLELLNISITNSCNGKCLYCCANSYKGTKNEVNITPQLSDLVKNKAPLIFSIGGGEPLLFPEKCLSYFNIMKDKAFLSLLTNLSIKLNPQILKVFDCMEKSRFSFLQTSIDTLNENKHNTLRKGTNLNQILKNIDFLTHNYSFKVKINCTVSGYNYQELKQIVDYITKNKMCSIHFNTVLPKGRAKFCYDIESLFNIIDALMEISMYPPFLSIKEHTISFPSELLQISLLEQENNKLVESISSISNAFRSTNYILHIDEDKDTMDVGWGESKSDQIAEDLQEGFEILVNNSSGFIYCRDCNLCRLNGKCNYESFYLGFCIISDLNKKFDFIINNYNHSSIEEKNRIKLLDYFGTKDNINNVIISMTRNCNGSCNFCQVNGSRVDAKQTFENEDVINFLANEQCYITITGGEPLMNIRKTEELIKSLKLQGHIVTLLTNGGLIDECFINTIAEYFTIFDVIQISVYSDNATTHRHISGRNDWEHINNVIGSLISKGIEVRLNLTVMPDNVDSLLDTFEHYRSLGVKQICINGLLRKGRAKDMFDMRHCIKYIYSLYNLCKKYKSGYKIAIPTELLKIYSNIKFLLGDKRVNNRLLVAEVLDVILIDYDGVIYSDKIGTELGCIKTSSIDKYEKTLIRRDLEKSDCKYCFSFEHCGATQYLEEIFNEFGNIDCCCCDKIVQDKIFS